MTLLKGPLLLAILLLGLWSTPSLASAPLAAVDISAADGSTTVPPSPLSRLRARLQHYSQPATIADDETQTIGQVAVQPSATGYPNVGVSSRNIVWVLAQLHLFFAALVLAVPLFVLVIEVVGLLSGDERYDLMGHEFMKITLTAFSITALLGGALTLALFVLYPDLMHYLTQVFGGQLLIYALLFFFESAFLYIYYYGWQAMRYGRRKWLHIGVGVGLNLAGTGLMVMANAWSTFMTAPSGVDELGRVVGTLWEVINGPLWQPLNLHRFIANIAFGGAVVGGYAAYKFLSARTPEQRAHYDWMGYSANFIAILAFLPLPFAGYWLMAEIYAYSQQMGIITMGGILAWIFIIQALLIGAILLAGNYYLWSGMSRSEGGARYHVLVPWIAAGLAICFMVWITPHNLIMSADEQAALGGSSHKILGPLGLMPAKNIAVNLMLILTFLSFQLFRRSDKISVVRWDRTANQLLVVIYVIAISNIIFAGVYYGYFTDTVYKVGSSVIQVVSTMVVIIAGIVIDTLIYRGAARLPSHWGEVSRRSQYALFVLPVAFTWLMALMGYVRSAMRSNWHVYTIMKDNSPDSYIPAIGTVGNMVTLVTMIFFCLMLFIFWIADLSGRQQERPEIAIHG